MIVIDAKKLIVGRLATFTAKKALQGETVRIINAEQAIITGNKKQIFARYRELREKGEPFHGPFFPTRCEAILKRMIRGMLPHKKTRGREALKRVRCYNTIPAELKDIKTITIKEANVSKLISPKYITLKDVSEFLK
ncbi:50S ribosomal protein L13 [archaeon]|jgi:large subunit ribosomal protein L13|nr:50S ribosomal protein L13 [archaeon]MBT4416912.1 50S ribosomal protein L13 [archaeon]